MRYAPQVVALGTTLPHSLGSDQVRASPSSSATLAPRVPMGFLRPCVVSFAVWCSISALISPPTSTMMVENHIHTMKPITAPSDPYVALKLPKFPTYQDRSSEPMTQNPPAIALPHVTHFH